MRAIAFLLSLAVLVASARAQPAEDPRSLAGFERWLAAEPTRSAAYADFQSHLQAQGVSDVVPAFELWRTATSAERCGVDVFVVPDRIHWDNVINTLRFVRDSVEPAIGQVEVVSAYRNERLNACAGGAPQSAHRLYFAVDLLPRDPAITRAVLIRTLCRVHADAGPARNIGLGFYTRARFHVDSMRFRRWGPNGRAATSPCLAVERGDAP